jgi:hypothetical protein
MEATIKAGLKWLEQCLKGHDSCRKKATLATIWSTNNMHAVRDLDHDDRIPRRLLWIDPITLMFTLYCYRLGMRGMRIIQSHEEDWLS